MAAMRLSDLLKRQIGREDPMIAGVTADSRKVRPGFLFAALPGAASDGRAFIPKAVEAGAAAVLAPVDTTLPPIPTAYAHDVRRAYALAARAFYGAEPETVVAVTGTNGKTSVATFCRQIFAHCGKASASLGTLGLQLEGEDLTPPGLTTPDAADVARFAAELTGRGVTHLAMEASSHGLDQRRLDGLTLKAAGFTNLSQDHLDYHATMGAYRDAKLRLFESLLPRGGTAVLNADSDEFPAFAAAAVLHGQTVMSVGESGVGVRQLARAAEPSGQRLTLDAGSGAREILLPLAGGFQASNALVAAGLCIAAGEKIDDVLAALEHLRGAPGRMQRVGAGTNGGEAYVDYAHTPDGLVTVLKALRPHATGRLIVVFGAGGDRDNSKRPLMGAAAASLADIAIVTDDNPRSEDPAEIRRQVLKGAPDALEVGDRRSAIRAAVGQLHEGDVLVVAGKGHEQGQMIAGVNHPFDDVAETRTALELIGG
jgi:UDP-N-acetylmuramoyl-L-alanyl-D-glutamate--2,6-diaminopimelate ligase